MYKIIVNRATLNRTLTANLHKDISESIESLSPLNKLKIISANEYTAGTCFEDYEANEIVKKIERYKFTYEGNGEVYNLDYAY